MRAAEAALSEKRWTWLSLHGTLGAHDPESGKGEIQGDDIGFKGWHTFGISSIEV